MAKQPFFVNLSMAAAAVFGAAASTPALAIDYTVSFNTSSIAGTAGEIDFQWNLGALDPSLTATVSSFSGTILGDPAVLSGDVSGLLGEGGSLNFAGGAYVSYAYQTLSFGPSISFQLTLPDRAPSQSGTTDFGAAFVVSLFDSQFSPVLPTLPSAFNDAALVFSLAPGEAPVLMQYTDATVTAVSPVPEPETYALLLVGLGVISFVRRRSRVRG